MKNLIVALALLMFVGAFICADASAWNGVAVRAVRFPRVQAIVSPRVAIVRQPVVVAQPFVAAQPLVLRQRVIVPHVQQFVVPQVQAFSVQSFVAPQVQAFSAPGCNCPTGGAAFFIR